MKYERSYIENRDNKSVYICALIDVCFLQSHILCDTLHYHTSTSTPSQSVPLRIKTCRRLLGHQATTLLRLLTATEENPHDYLSLQWFSDRTTNFFLSTAQENSGTTYPVRCHLPMTLHLSEQYIVLWHPYSTLHLYVISAIFCTRVYTSGRLLTNVCTATDPLPQPIRCRSVVGYG